MLRTARSSLGIPLEKPNQSRCTAVTDLQDSVWLCWSSWSFVRFKLTGLCLSWACNNEKTWGIWACDPRLGVRLEAERPQGLRGESHRPAHTQPRSLTEALMEHVSRLILSSRTEKQTHRENNLLFVQKRSGTEMHSQTYIQRTLKICHISQCIQSETPCEAETHAMSNYMGSPRTGFFQPLSPILVSNKVWNDKRVPDVCL